MRDPQNESVSEGPLRCALCGDVIGVYEPLLLEIDDESRVTSRAAEPGLSSSAGAQYHVACRQPGSIGSADVP